MTIKNDYYDQQVFFTLEAVIAACNWSRLPASLQTQASEVLNQLSISGKKITAEELLAMIRACFDSVRVFTTSDRIRKTPYDRHAASLSMALAKALQLAKAKQYCIERDFKGATDAIKIDGLSRELADSAFLVIMTDKRFKAHKKADLCANIALGLLGHRIEESERQANC